MSKLGEYIIQHAVRGECQCGQCIDKGEAPDPNGHVADMVFFKVSLKGDPDADVLRGLLTEHPGDFGQVDVFDGAEHNYIELGGWLGDQGMALMLMGLGSLLGLWELLTPLTVMPPGLAPAVVQQMAGAGMIAVCAQKATP